MTNYPTNLTESQYRTILGRVNTNCHARLQRSLRGPAALLFLEILPVFLRKSALQSLEIRLQWSAAKCSLIIEPTDIDDPDGFPVIGQTYAKYGSLFIGSITLIHEIWAAINWDKTLRFRIVAKYNEPSNVAIFEMKNAIASEIPRNIRGGRPKKSKKF